MRGACLGGGPLACRETEDVEKKLKRGCCGGEGRRSERRRAAEEFEAVIVDDLLAIWA